MHVLLDTANSQEKRVYLFFEDKTKDKIFVKKISNARNTQSILKILEDFLKKYSLSFGDLEGVGAVLGPGGFTSLRQGIVCANVLSYALKIPLAGLKKVEILRDVRKNYFKKIKKGTHGFLEPHYGKEPNITILQ